LLVGGFCFAWGRWSMDRCDRSVVLPTKTGHLI
jgi:hypothetical protein